MSLLLLAVTVLGGTALTLFDDDDTAPFHARLAAGAALGLVLWALLGYLLATRLGVGAVSASLAALLVVAPGCAVPRARWRLLRPQRPARAAVAWALALSAVLALVYDRASFATRDGIFTGIEHNLGDLPFHIGIAAGFSEGQNIPPEHPELAGVRLTYPFLADFGVAQLAALGMPLTTAFRAHNLALALALLGLLHRFARRSTGDPLAAALAPLLLFASGGLGFVWLWQEGRAAGIPLLTFLQRLPHDATITASGELRFGNSLICLLTPQRSLLFGTPLVLIALDRLWAASSEADGPRRRRLFAAAGLAAGLLPLVHAHALAALLAVAACLGWLFPPRRAWLVFFGVALLLALPQLWWLASGSSLRPQSFVAWEPGWDSGGRPLLAFWLMNAGLFLPALILACLGVAPARLVRFHLPFWGLFLAPNLLRLSPWIWDNIKFLFFWLLASTPLVALVIARLWRRERWWRPVAAALLVTLTLSGGLDLWRVASRQIELKVFDKWGIAFARALERATPPHALLARAPTHDSPALLAGRRSVLGYAGHLWSQGLDAGTREADLRAIYGGAPDAAALLERYGVDDLVIGPQERGFFRIDAGFVSRFPVALEVGPYQLRRVR